MRAFIFIALFALAFLKGLVMIFAGQENPLIIQVQKQGNKHITQQIKSP